jgi:DNA polymerase-1
MVRPRLEGDDILGILATWQKVRGEKVIVSIDKDMKTIPGLYCRDLDAGIVEVSEEEADNWHLIQTLAGDQTDGYPGCPGIGMDRAAKAILEPTILVPYEHELTRGPRKGEIEIRYREEPTDDKWQAVVTRYAAAGLSEEVALMNARVARILRASDYDFKNKRPILWTPTAAA